MAILKGIAEKIQGPVYDALKVPPEETLGSVEGSATFRFFVNVQSKTKLETNLQAASLLPHYNTFEARAMRVVISDLPPRFPDDVSQESADHDLTQPDGEVATLPDPRSPDQRLPVQADVDIALDRLIALLREARASDEGIASVDLDDTDVITLIHVRGQAEPVSEDDLAGLIEAGVTLDFTAGDLEAILDEIDEKERPLEQQIDPNNGAGTLIGKIIYNSVISLYVGEKLMIQMPTWFFPGGAGPYSETASITTHGTPSPQDTFRFAEPVCISTQQNFRVEMEIPDTDVLKELQRIYGPLYIWVVLDGYMTRSVQ